MGPSLVWLDRDTLTLWMKRNKAFRAAWDELRPVFLAADPRGASRWVFAMGYLAGQRDLRAMLTGLAEELSAATAQVLDKRVRDLDKRTNRRLLGLED